VAPVPATITVPGNHAWTDFQFMLGQVTVPTPVTITATLNGVSVADHLTVLPMALRSVQVSPAAVSSGTSAIIWANLQGPAPAGGLALNVSSNSPAASVPATITVPAGAWSMSIPVTTSIVTQPTAATITVSGNGVSQQVTMTVAPPRQPSSIS